MTNYEKIYSNFVSLFGDTFDFSKDTLKMYAKGVKLAGLENDCNCCPFTIKECYHRHGTKTPEELEAEGYWEEYIEEYYYDEGRVISCKDLILEWLDEEYKEP